VQCKEEERGSVRLAADAGLIPGPAATERAAAGLMAFQSRWNLPLNPEDYELMAHIAVVAAHNSESSLTAIHEWAQRMIDSDVPTQFFVAGNIRENLADPRLKAVASRFLRGECSVAEFDSAFQEAAAEVAQERALRGSEVRLQEALDDWPAANEHRRIDVTDRLRSIAHAAVEDR